MLEKQLQGSLSKLESKVEVNIEQDLENKVWHKVVDALGGKVKEQLAKQMGVLEGDLVNGTTAGPDLTLQPSTTAVVVPSVVAVKSPWTLSLCCIPFIASQTRAIVPNRGVTTVGTPSTTRRKTTHSRCVCAAASRPERG